MIITFTNFFFCFFFQGTENVAKSPAFQSKQIKKFKNFKKFKNLKKYENFKKLKILDNFEKCENIEKNFKSFEMF